jgi:hypothetical protein
MTHIETHHWTRDASEMFETFETSISNTFEDLPVVKNHAEALFGMARSGIGLASFAAVVSGERLRVMRGLRIAAEATAIGFELVERPGHAIDAVIDGRSCRLVVSRPPTIAPGPSEWRSGFYAACACRHPDALARLCRVSRDVLNRSRPAFKYDKCDPNYDIVPALQAIALGSADAGARLEYALGGGNWPNANLVLRLYEGDAQKFNDALEAELLAHRAFWTQPPSEGDFTDDRREHPHGFLALAPLGLACLAHDRGIPIEVDSPYIPTWIVRRGRGEESS